VNTGDAEPGGQDFSTASMHWAERCQKRSINGSKSAGVTFGSDLITATLKND
jgi:hypothetical protein